MQSRHAEIARKCSVITVSTAIYSNILLAIFAGTFPDIVIPNPPHPPIIVPGYPGIKNPEEFTID